MNSNTFDAIVLGGGGMGRAAAYYLSRMGQKVLVLERFELDHSYGSSNDHSRIIRYAYDHPDYIKLVGRAYDLWRELEAASGMELLTITGGIDLGRLPHPRFAATRQSMLEMGIPFEELDSAQIHERFPQFTVAEDVVGLYQAEAGAVRAARCNEAHLRLAQAAGAQVLATCPVSQLRALPNGVEVDTPQGTFSAARLVVTAGAWAGQVLKDLDLSLPLVPSREQVAYFEAQPAELYSAARMPVYIFWGDEIFYGIPSVSPDHGLKCAQHLALDPCDPDTVNRNPDEAYIQKLRAFMRGCFPEVADRPLQVAKICFYTMTPDEHFILDQHPAYPHIAIGAGFSGHGFKFASLIGKILAEMASQEPLPYELDLFKLGRFKSL
jgi:monomeric sarcosine oxidase